MIVKIALPLILAFIMFSLGLGLRLADFARVLQFPKAFAVGLANQVVLLPLIAFALATAFRLPPELAVGVMILALCPGGVTTNVLTRIARGNTPLSISLTATTSLLSILTVPLLVALAVNHFMGGQSDEEVNITKLGVQMFLITAVPVGIGMVVTALAPQFADRRGPLIVRIAQGLFVLLIIAALVENWEVFSSNLVGLGPALVLLNVILLALGLATAKAARLDRRDATTISIESGIQNGTLAIAVGSFIAMSATETLPPTTVPAAVYSITMYFVSLPFVFWRRKLEGTKEAS